MATVGVKGLTRCQSCTRWSWCFNTHEMCRIQISL